MLSCRNYFGNFLVTARLKNRWSQADLAEKLNVDAKYISKLECGRVNVTLDTIDNYLELLHIKHDELFKPLPVI